MKPEACPARLEEGVSLWAVHFFPFAQTASVCVGRGSPPALHSLGAGLDNGFMI